MTENNDIPTIDSIRAAHARITPWIHNTPVLTCSTFNTMSRAQLFFKCENFQKVGAFKARGAHNAVFSLTDEVAKKGIATHSSGNHGAALACAAASRGIPATVVIPENAPQVKMNAVKSYGGTIVTCAANVAARESTLQSIVEQSGATFIHPYNNFEVITGQATCALELLEDMPDLDVLITPVGGGGLLSGSAITAKSINPKIAIYAAEPHNADDAKRSLEAGEIMPMDSPNTIADGLKTPLGSLTFPLISELVEDILLVSEQQIVDAMKLTWERMKIVIEPSSATVLAAILAHPEPFVGKRVGAIFTGGNVNLAQLPWLSSQ